MKFFLDTEFTNLPWEAHSELLWIALVDETGTREFSAVNDDCDVSACSAFVRQHVVPQLDRAHVRLPRTALAAAVTHFIASTSAPEFWAWQPSVADIAHLAGSTHAQTLHTQFADWDYRLALDLVDGVALGWPSICHDVHPRVAAARVQLPRNTHPHDALADAHWARAVWFVSAQRKDLKS